MSEHTPGGAGFVPGVKPPEVREFTPRAVACAIVVAVIVGASYPYVVLKLGFGPNISVVSAFLGYLFLGLCFRNYNRWENNMVQTAGTAAGQTAFMCSVVAAFDILILGRDSGSGFGLQLSVGTTFLWLSICGVLGVLMAVPLRRHFIEDEKLPYPDGMAAGQTLIVLDSRGPEAKVGVFALGTGMLVSALNFLPQKLLGTIDALKMHWVNRFAARTGVGIELSFLALGSGMLLGPRINLSMLIGASASWIVIPPLLAHNGVIAEGASKRDILLWVMWPAVGLLVAGGLTSLCLKWGAFKRTITQFSGSAVDGRDVPLRWVVSGSLAATAALAVFQRQAFGLPVWQTLIAVLLAIPMMLVGLRVLGETNWGPITALSNLMQALFGMIAPGDIRSNMVASGNAGTVAAESEGLIQDYKAGWMIGSTPRVLTTMQLIAVPFGALAVALAYPALIEAYPWDSDRALGAPASQRWAGFAKILSQGAGALPAGAMPAAAVGVVLGVLLTMAEQRRTLRRVLPSPTGIGIGMLVPFATVATMCVGGLIDVLWRRLAPRHAEQRVIPMASGLIAGESLTLVILLLLSAAGLVSLSS
jgi:uncharacterized oligopeptide transporter (OPT) family protein